MRSRNQDAFLVADLTAGRTGLGPEMATHEIGERGSLLAVSDGTGERGERASEMAVAAFQRVLSVVPDGLPTVEQMRRAAHHTARHLYAYFRRGPGFPATGATLTAVLVRGDVAHVAQVGDSRAYLVRGDRIEQITKDQTLAQALLDSGAIEHGGSRSRPPDMMLQSFGPDPGVRAVVTTTGLRAGDALLVCSDGLSNAVDAAEISAAVRGIADPDGACRLLVDLAVSRGGDNVTVVLARVESLGREISPNEAVTQKLPGSPASEH